MSEEKKEILTSIAKAVSKMNDCQANRIAGIAEGMVLKKEDENGKADVD